VADHILDPTAPPFGIAGWKWLTAVFPDGWRHVRHPDLDVMSVELGPDVIADADAAHTALADAFQWRHRPFMAGSHEVTADDVARSAQWTAFLRQARAELVDADILAFPERRRGNTGGVFASRHAGRVVDDAAERAWYLRETDGEMGPPAGGTVVYVLARIGRTPQLIQDARKTETEAAAIIGPAVRLRQGHVL